MTLEKLLKPYNAQETEGAIYKKWEEAGLFKPEANKDTQTGGTFSMVLPPPNVTGTLHLGHSAMLAIEDIMVRYHRMKGDQTLWVPGTDHAAIATQSKVEGIIYKEEGLRRHDFTREELFERIREFAQKSHDTIVSQVRAMGASVDWTREAYTLDETRSLVVRTAFKRMFDDGLIYRKYRIVNWDPKGQTTVSDDEVNHTETTGKFYTFRYTKDFPIPIATTRPETKVGDTAVAVHPNGKYKEYIGREYDLVFAGVKLHIKVIGEESIDEAFGTGALGVTPAHSQIDWEMSQRHDLPIIPVINELAKMKIPASQFDAGDILELNGKKTLEARELIVNWLKDQGLLEKEEEIPINLSVAERTGGTIEPLPKLQWFIDVNKKFTLQDSKIKGLVTGSEVSLKELMRQVVASGQIEIIPEYFAKTYFHWIDNLHDWCISRQIIFGHRIPVFYHKKEDGKEETLCEIEPPKEEGWEQDPDTLDTWFSSGLWTFSTLGWPSETKELQAFHPTAVLETGYDILFFWVARMILMTGYLLNDIPFKKVYLHGLVRDGQGRKMSKSLGNIIDPLDMIAKYGTDAVRLSLIMGTAPGTDSKLSEDKIRGYQKFANKIWNIARFVLTNTEDFDAEQKVEYTPDDQARVDELNKIVADATGDMDNYRFYLAGEKIYHYVWHSFADEIIEATKDRLKEGSGDKQSAQKLLRLILETSLKLLHPFMPFVTEEVWSMLPGKKEMLIITEWPK